MFLYMKTNILRGSAYLNVDFAIPGEPATIVERDDPPPTLV